MSTQLLETENKKHFHGTEIYMKAKLETLEMEET